MVLTPGAGEPQGVLGSSPLVLESRRVCWGPHSWCWRAAGCAGVLTPGAGEPQGVLGSSFLVLESPQGVPGSSLLVLESRRVCWGPHSWSWRAAGCAGVLTPGPGEPQGGLGSSFLVPESRRVCWGPHPWSWRAAGCAGVLNPGPGEQQGVLAFVVTQHLIECPDCVCASAPVEQGVAETDGGSSRQQCVISLSQANWKVIPVSV